MSDNLIDCPDCSREISVNAYSCPHCGCPIRKKRGCLSVFLQLFLVAFLLLVVASFFIGDNDDEASDEWVSQVITQDVIDDQSQRKAYIARLKSLDVIRDVERGSGLSSTVVIGENWHLNDFAGAQNVCEMIMTFEIVADRSKRYLHLRDHRTNKRIASYSYQLGLRYE